MKSRKTNAAVFLNQQYNIVFDDTAIPQGLSWNWLSAHWSSVLSLGWTGHRAAHYRLWILLNNVFVLGTKCRYFGNHQELYQLRLPFVAIRYALFLLSTISLRIDAVAGSMIYTLPFVLVTLILSESTRRFAELRYAIEHCTWGQLTGKHQVSLGAFFASECQGLFLSMVSGGIYLPWWFNRRFDLMYGHLQFGEIESRYTGSADEVLIHYANWIPISIATCGLGLIWLNQRLMRYRTSHLWIGGDKIGTARGVMMVRASEVLKFKLRSVVTAILSLGCDSLQRYRAHLHFIFWKAAFIGQLNLDTVTDELKDAA